MSINTAHANNGVLIHAGEYILLHSDNVSMEFNGQDNPVFKGSKAGRIYLTSHRMIFNNKKPGDGMQSFSAPFVAMSDLELEQPVFGANYIKGKVRAQPNGNFVGEVKFKLYFKAGGAIEYGQALRRASLTAQSNMRNGGQSDDPPPYTPSGAWHEAPPPAYQPPPGYYGWLPTHDAFSGPPPNSVFMSDNPPPYAGIGGPPPYTPQQPFAGGPPQQPYAGGLPPQQYNNSGWNGFSAQDQQPPIPQQGGWGAPQQGGWGAPAAAPNGGWGSPAPVNPGDWGSPSGPAAGWGAPSGPAAAWGAPTGPGAAWGAPAGPAGGHQAPPPYGYGGPGHSAQGAGGFPAPATAHSQQQQQPYNPQEPPSWNGFSLPPTDSQRQPSYNPGSAGGAGGFSAANAKEAEALASAHNTTENQRGNVNAGELPPSYNDLPPNYNDTRKPQ